MQVIKLSFEQMCHTQFASLVAEEIRGFSCESANAFLAAPVYAVATRVLAIAAHAFWICSEAINFFPRMISLAVGLAVSERAGITTAFFQRVAHVYGLFFRASAAQFALGTMACVIPELSYYVLELQKSLFPLQLETFIESLPDFPHIPKRIRESYKPIDSLIKLYSRLGFTNDDFRYTLRKTLQGFYDIAPSKAAMCVTTDSLIIQKAYINTLISLVAKELNARQEKGTFCMPLIHSLNPALWYTMKDNLRDATLGRLIDLLQVTMHGYEANPIFNYLYTCSTKFRYRAPDSSEACRILLEKMKGARNELLTRKIFSEDDILMVVGSSMSAVTIIGLLRFIQKATLNEGQVAPSISFTSAAGKKITFAEVYQFFGAKEQLVDLKKEIDTLNSDELEALFQRCCDDRDAVKNALGSLHPLIDSENVAKSHNLLQQVKIKVIDPASNNENLSPESTVNWFEAFTG